MLRDVGTVDVIVLEKSISIEELVSNKSVQASSLRLAKQTYAHTAFSVFARNERSSGGVDS